MKLLSTFRLTTSALLCAVLVACAGPEPATPTVARAPAPKDFEKTIKSYFAFRIRNPQKNTELSFGAPEPGECALDGYVNSARGWVVPVVYATFTGAPATKEPINITTKQYYFWFLGDTIAGITLRMELCPGVGAIVSDDARPGAASLLTTAFPSSAKPDGQRRDAVDPAESARAGRAQAKTGAAQKQETVRGAKKTGSSSDKVRKTAKKVRKAPAKIGAEADNETKK